jgi:hypothetical protein
MRQRKRGKDPLSCSEAPRPLPPISVPAKHLTGGEVVPLHCPPARRDGSVLASTEQTHLRSGRECNLPFWSSEGLRGGDLVTSRRVRKDLSKCFDFRILNLRSYSARTHQIGTRRAVVFSTSRKGASSSRKLAGCIARDDKPILLSLSGVRAVAVPNNPVSQVSGFFYRLHDPAWACGRSLNPRPCGPGP